MTDPQSLTTRIEREGAMYVAHCPELDITSQGKTIGSARRNLAEAISLFLDCADSAEVQVRRVKAMTAQRIIFASSNPHKVEEVRAILEPAGIVVIGLNDLDAELVPDEPDETGATFEENARLKAVYYAQQLGEACLADDSGLEVDALGGAPGIYSARYAEDGTTRAERDAANNRKLLAALRDVPDEKRTARFVCAMCLAGPNGTILAETRGEFPGVIAHEPRGSNGFGYDPLLFLPDLDCTSAELSPEEKNARSHRGAAARRMAVLFRHKISL